MCVWLTGLSGAGKTTTAAALSAELTRHGHEVLVLDGDVVRASDAPPLGFTSADRDENVMRTASRARAAVERGTLAICALISPYRTARARAREVIGPHRFLEIFVDAPLDVCEQRDTKGLYARARRGEIANLTGVTDVYEHPIAPDLVLSTVQCSVAHNVSRIMRLLYERGVVERSRLES